MIIFKTELFKHLKSMGTYYETQINEAQNPFEISEDDTDTEEALPDEEDIDLEGRDENTMDPTEIPDDNSDIDPESIPENEGGAFVSDNKVAMFANLLTKALTASPVELPQNLQNVTSDNAEEIIAFAEKILKLNEPTKGTNDLIGQI